MGIRVSQSQWLNPYVEFKKQKRIDAERPGDMYEQAIYRLMNNAVYGGTMENLRKCIDAKKVSNKK